MKLLLIGCGFLGSYLVRRLLANRPQNEKDPDFKLIIMDKVKRAAFKKNPLVNMFDSNPNLEYRWNSAGDPWTLLQDFVDGIDVVVYTAAIADVPYAIKNPIDTIQSNCVNPTQFLEFLRSIDYQGRFIMMSSESSYGHQPAPDSGEWNGINEDTALMPAHSNIYGLTKFFQEGVARVYHKSFGIKSTVIRSGTMYGLGSRPDQAIPIFVGQALSGNPISLEGGDQTRDFNHVENVVDAIMAVIHAEESDVVGQVFNIGSGTEIRFDELAKAIKFALKSPSNIEIRAYRPGEKGLRIKLDIGKAKKILKYEPHISLFPDGLADVAEGVAFYDLMWSKEECAKLRGLIGKDPQMAAQLLRQQMVKEEKEEEQKNFLMQQTIKAKSAQQQFPPAPRPEEEEKS